MKKLLLLLLISNYSANAIGQNSIKDFDWIVGKWNITATEQASNGNSFTEVGYLECSWVLNKRVIRMNWYVQRIKAKGRYAKGAKRRSLVSYLVYNSKKKHFKLIYIRSSRSDSYVFNATKAGVELKSNPSTFYEPDLGFKLSLVSTITKLDQDHFTELEILNQVGGSFKERYELKATRLE